ncbi:unnamed protein product [Acanthocheilonema viteae]|uniref:Uncharacterized protein n=1 Tax=Acanthocheilonema viteae TaxID=6277 RepID=A0A498SYP2_ACAVI|nr:unnamed protein product [Acanthocheilonema viteae]
MCCTLTFGEKHTPNQEDIPDDDIPDKDDIPYEEDTVGREYTVIGQLMCGEKFLNGSHVEIRTMNEYAAAGYRLTLETNGTGQFQGIVRASFFSGSLKKQLMIYHDCDVDVDVLGNEVKVSFDISFWEIFKFKIDLWETGC